MKKILIFLAAMAMGGALEARAELITNDVQWASALTDWTNTQAVARFNPVLGTLTQVSFVISMNEDTAFAVTNNSTSAGSQGSVQTVLRFALYDPSHLIAPGMTNTFPASAFLFDLPVGPSTTNSPTYHVVNDSTWAYSDGLVLGEFIAPPGTNILTGLTMTFTEATFSGGNAAIVQTTHADADVKIIYEYVIPEPMDAALLLVGGALLLLRRQFRVVWSKLPG